MAPLPLFAEIRGLEQFWAQYSLRARHVPRHDQRDRMLFDLLGIGLEQGMQHLAVARPSAAAFAEWVIAAAGPPDPVAIARYHAWLDRAPPPPQVQARIAAIEAMAPVLDSADLAHWETEGVTMAAGETWYLRLSDPHRVDNLGDSPRVHLVIDADLSPWLIGQLDQGAAPPMLQGT